MRRNVDKFIFFLFLFISAITIFISCEYEPEGDYFNEIKTNLSTSNVKIESLDLSFDTITLWNKRAFKYKFTCDDQKIRRVNFYLRNSEIFPPDDYEFYFDAFYRDSGLLVINWDDLIDGPNELKVKIRTTTGSGSIAEDNWEEFKTKSFKWIVIAHKKEKKPFNFSCENGNLKISWNKPNDVPNVEGYEIRKYYNSTLTKTIVTDSNSCIDTEYVGERVAYKIFVRKTDGSIKELYRLDKFEELPKLHIYGSKSNEYFITWSKNKYYNSVKNYKLSYYSTIENKLIEETVNANDSIVPIFGNYGQINSFTHTTIPKQSSEFLSTEIKYFQKKYNIRIGSPLKYNIFERNGITPLHSNMFIIRDSLNVSIYSPLEEKLFNIPYNHPERELFPDKYDYMDVSHDGQIFAIKSYGTWWHLYEQNITPIDYKHTIKNNNWIHKYFVSSICSNGIMALYNPSSYWGSEKEIIIYKFKEDQIVSKIISGNGEYAKLSITGEFVIVEQGFDDMKELFRIEDGLFKRIIKISSNEFNILEFHKTKPNIIIACKNQKEISIKNVSDFSEVNTYSITGEQILSIDSEFNQVYTIKDGKSYIRNLDSGQIEKEFDFVYKDSRLYGKIIFDNAGLFYYIN